MKLGLKGTPAPWSVTTNPLETDGRVASVWRSHLIGGEIAATHIGDVENTHDAYLISAAPDLLLAAMQFLIAFELGQPQSVETYRAFKEAVRKALDLTIEEEKEHYLEVTQDFGKNLTAFIKVIESRQLCGPESIKRIIDQRVAVFEKLLQI